VLLVLVAYRLLSPGSEWRLHREWFDKSALGDLPGSDGSLSEINTLYRCHDLLLAHKEAVFDHLTGRWRDLFNASFEVLLYDLTSTYFESDPPFPECDKRRYGYSRDHRPDCVQVVVALVITPEGISKATSPSVPSSISSRRVSKPTSSSPSSLTACTSPWHAGSMPWRPGSPQKRVREVLRRADDRRRDSNNRRPPAAAHPLHRARTRTPIAARKTEAGAPTPATPENYRSQARSTMTA
jgi:hypothetical protein